MTEADARARFRVATRLDDLLEASEAIDAAEGIIPPTSRTSTGDPSEDEDEAPDQKLAIRR